MCQPSAHFDVEAALVRFRVDHHAFYQAPHGVDEGGRFLEATMFGGEDRQARSHAPVESMTPARKIVD